MAIPGSNLLDLALTVIGTVAIEYYPFVSRELNSVGQWITTYATTPMDINASVQAIPRKTYSQMGLDFNKQYIAIWASADLTNLMRERPGDQLVWNGNRYEIMEESDWHPIDGWDSIIAVKVLDPS